MAYVVPRLESIQYNGSNGAALSQMVVASGYWTLNQGYVGGIRWIGAEGDRITIPDGGYLVHDGQGSFWGMSADDYQARYHEIP